MTSDVQRDERTVFVENTSYKRAYFLLSYGLLVVVAYRAFFFRQATWDLMGLAVAGGILSLAYQSRHDLPLARKNALLALVTAVLAAVFMTFAFWTGQLR